MPLILKSRLVSRVVVLDLIGRLWILDLPLRDKISGLLNEGYCHFVLNLAGVSYIDSSGLGQLVSIWSSIRSRNGNMTLLNPTKRVAKLLEITKLNTIFEILEVEPEAVKRAGGTT
ncbi:MAG TPA: STAS domain-containing protein [Terriglobia bacterium]|nr:STAS domain-containing protein [Terriglobia bacterium]